MNARALLVRPDGAVRAPWAILFFLFAAALATGFFATILYPLVALVFLAGASALLFGALQEAQGIALGAFAVMLLGFPVGYVWKRRSANIP